MGAAGVNAACLLRGTGGRTVLLRIPTLAIAGDLGEQVGLGVPGFNDVEIGPALFRRVRPRVGAEEVRYELLVSGGDVSVQMVRDAAGVVVDGVMLGIASAVESEAFGEVYLWRLGLRGDVI